MFHPIKNIKYIPSVKFDDLIISHVDPTIPKFNMISKNTKHSSNNNNINNNKKNQPIVAKDDIVEVDKHTEEHPTTSSEYISAWHFGSFNIMSKNKKTILFCHGNSGNISHRDYMINFCHGFGINLFLFDYRGYGDSSFGVSSPRIILADGLLAYDYLTTKVSPKDIIVWGESLGGAVAGYIAANRNPYRLLLMATFSSVTDIIAQDEKKYSSIARFFSRIIPSVIDDLSTKSLNITCPTLVAHSEGDNVIPIQSARVLFDSLKSKKKLFVTIEGDHSTPILTEEHIQKVFEFCGLDYSDSKHGTRFIKDIHTAAVRHCL